VFGRKDLKKSIRCQSCEKKKLSRRLTPITRIRTNKELKSTKLLFRFDLRHPR